MAARLTLTSCFVIPWLACVPLRNLDDVTDGTGQSIAGASGDGGEGSGGTVGVASGGAAGEGGDAATGGGNVGGSAPVEVCDGSYAFCDDFESGDPSGWTPSGGTWAIVESNGNLFYRGTGSEKSVAGDPGWTDQTVAARVRVVAFGSETADHRVGVIARYESSSSFYVFAVGGDGNATLLKTTNPPGGSLGECGPVPVSVTVGEWFDVRIEVSGPDGNVRIKTFVDLQEIHNCTTTSTTVSSGSVGLSVFGSGTQGDFDDVRVSL